MAAGGKRKKTARRGGWNANGNGNAAAGGGISKLGPRRGRAATAADAAANNPFERIRVHTKFDILGAKKTKTRAMRNDATERVRLFVLERFEWAAAAAG